MDRYIYEFVNDRQIRKLKFHKSVIVFKYKYEQAEYKSIVCVYHRTRCILCDRILFVEPDRFDESGVSTDTAVVEDDAEDNVSLMIVGSCDKLLSATI